MSRAALMLGAATLLLPALAAGQLVPPLAGAPASFDFAFANPGARSLGFGGAFVALADDATAAFANPAGLVKLARPEVSLEVRSRDYETPFLAGGRIGGTPTGVGLDVDPDERRGASERSVEALSFASFVHPRERWALALYYHRPVAFESAIRSEGIFGERAQPFPPRYAEMLSVTDSHIETFGAAVGVRVGDRLSVGAGVSRFAVDLSTVSRFYFPSRPTPDELFGPIPLDDAHLGLVVTLAAEEHDWGFHGGFLWQVAESWSIGGFYREGAEFPLGIQVRSGAGLPVPPGASGPPPGTLLAALDVDPVEFPAVYGLGASWRSRDGATTLAIEWDRVGYSAILDSFDRALGGTGGLLDDADELHLGAEYVFLDATPVVALRGGAWYDPDHQVRREDPFDPADPDPDAELLAALFPPGEDRWHFALGLGFAFERLQLDLAADLSERVDTLSLSAIFTF